MGSTSKTEVTYDLSKLETSERKWRQSSGLRLVYGDIYGAIAEAMQPGAGLELGSGIGRSKDFIPSIVTSDIVKTRYVDMACSAYAIPASSETGRWANIVAVDVLHHLCRPIEFLESAAKGLQDNGRIILVEPAATAFGKAFYTLFHEEPIRPGAIQSPYGMEPDDEQGEFANMGMGVALFVRDKNALNERLSSLGLQIETVRFRDLIAYPSTGGYSGRQLLPTGLIRVLLSLEKRLPQAVLRFLGLRMLIVIRKDPPSNPGS